MLLCSTELTSFSVTRVSSSFFLCSVTSHAFLEVCVAIHNEGERIPISHPGIRTSCQPPDTYMNPYKAIPNFGVAHIAEIRSSFIGR